MRTTNTGLVRYNAMRKRGGFTSLEIGIPNRGKAFCKIEVRHILFKEICFFDFFK